jgi:hypothetical protein
MRLHLFSHRAYCQASDQIGVLLVQQTKFGVTLLGVFACKSRHRAVVDRAPVATKSNCFKLPPAWPRCTSVKVRSMVLFLGTARALT